MTQLDRATRSSSITAAGARRSITAGSRTAIQCCVALEAALYSCLAPLIPYFARRFHFGPGTAGALVASAAVGGIAGLCVLRLMAPTGRSRLTLVLGLGTLAVASLAFAAATTTPTLLAARAIQGVGGTLAWGGALEWVMAAPGAIGESLGSTFASATYGTLAGPLIGEAAVAVSPVPVFATTAVAAAALACVIAKIDVVPMDRAPSVPRTPRLVELLRLPGAAAMYPLCWTVIGLALTLLPLDLHARGASTALVGATFVSIGVVNALTSARIGKLCDRVGPAQPLCVAASVSVVALAILAVTRELVVTEVLTVLLLGLFRNGWLVPAAVLIGTDTPTERTGMANPLRLLLWTIIGEGVGAALGGTLAATAGQPIAFTTLAGMTAVGLALTLRTVGFRAAHPHQPSP